MDELILKIKELKAIQPERGWAQTLKAEILSQDNHEEQFSMDFGFLRNRAFFIVPSVLMILVIGIFFYTRNVLYPEMASINVQALETISSGLRRVETEIVRTTSNLEKITEAEKALEIGEKVLAALENGGQVVAVTKQIVESEGPKAKQGSPEVFTVISGVEYAAEELDYALRDMEQTYLERQKELAKDLIEELGTRSLNETQQSLLEQAKNEYSNGLFSDALIKVIETSQSQ